MVPGSVMCMDTVKPVRCACIGLEWTQVWQVRQSRTPTQGQWV